MPKRKKVRKLKPIHIVLSFACGLFVVTTFWSLYLGLRFLKVERVECRLDGNSRCPDQLLDSITYLYGTSLLLSDHQDMITTSQLQFPATLNKISRQLPNTLVLTFDSEESVFAIEFNSVQQQVARSGKVFSTSEIDDSLEFFVIATSSAFVSEHQLQQDIVDSLASISESLSRNEILTESLTVTDDHTLEIKLESGSQLVIDSSNPGNWVPKYIYIQQEISKNPQEYPVPHKIDLRFRQPVLSAL